MKKTALQKTGIIALIALALYFIWRLVSQYMAIPTIIERNGFGVDSASAETQIPDNTGPVQERPSAENT